MPDLEPTTEYANESTERRKKEPRSIYDLRALDISIGEDPKKNQLRFLETGRNIVVTEDGAGDNPEKCKEWTLEEIRAADSRAAEAIEDYIRVIRRADVMGRRMAGKAQRRDD